MENEYSSGRTQLQIRIDCSVKMNKGFDFGARFFDFEEHSTQPFLNEFYVGLTEEDVKTADSLEELRPAIHYRLAQMQYEQDYVENIKKHFYEESSLNRILFGLDMARVDMRNFELKLEAISNARRRQKRYL